MEPKLSSISQRLASLGNYAFAAVDEKVADLRARGVQPIDFGVGDPTDPTPPLIRDAAKAAIDVRRSAGYPSYIGDATYRGAISAWFERRFGVALDPDSELSASVGAKEAVVNVHEALVDPGDIVLCPSPGYPPYSRGALFAEGQAYYMPLAAENQYLIDFAEIPSDVAAQAKLMWLNYPNSPTGALANKRFYEDAFSFAKSHNVIIASDEAYSEIYFGAEAPLSVLNVQKQGALVFNSLSKRSAMTTYRVGWVAGDPELVAHYRKAKTNIDSGTPTFIQDAAVAALGDESHVEGFRETYRQRRDVLCAALGRAGLADCTPPATLYVWQRVPEGMTALAFAERLLEPDVAVVTTPGPWISDQLPDGSNPGDRYVRFALVPSLENTRLAADRIANLVLS
jgi:LL-diaminopimelate aminotransferase